MRLAIYFAPSPDHVLHRLGSAWLGRDAATGAPAAQPPVAGLDAAQLAAITASPRRYGLHATLAPPFALADGADPAGLAAALAALAARLAPAELVPRLGLIEGFCALLPAAPVPAVSALAAACVELADGFRARPGPAELARRRAAGLTPRQEALLQRWGYPYVHEEFRFHMTLSERLPEAACPPVLAALERHFAPALGRPVQLDALALFVEPEPGAPFVQQARFPLLAIPQPASAGNRFHA